MSRTMTGAMLLGFIIGCGTHPVAPAPQHQSAPSLSGAEVYAVLPPAALGGVDGCVFESAAGDAVGCVWHRLDNGQYVSRFEAHSATGKVLDVEYYRGWLEGFDEAQVDADGLRRANEWLTAVGARRVERPGVVRSGEGDAAGLPVAAECCAWRASRARVAKGYALTVFNEVCCFELAEGAEPPEGCEVSWYSTVDERDACESESREARQWVRFTSRPSSP